MIILIDFYFKEIIQNLSRKYISLDYNELLKFLLWTTWVLKLFMNLDEYSTCSLIIQHGLRNNYANVLDTEFWILLPSSSFSEAKDGEYLEGNSRYEGYSFDLIDGIAKILNFNYRIEIVPDGKYGSLNKETKKWDGLVKHLLDRVSLVLFLFFIRLYPTSTPRKLIWPSAIWQLPMNDGQPWTLPCPLWLWASAFYLRSP